MTRIGHNAGPPLGCEVGKLQAIDAVLHEHRYTQTEALVLIGLIVRSDADFANAFPGGATLATYAKVKTTDPVFKALRRLENDFEVIERRSRGQGRSNAYVVLPRRVVQSIIAEYETLKASKANGSHPPQAGGYINEATQIKGVGEETSHPPNKGELRSEPTQINPVGSETHPSKPGATHPSQAGTIHSLSIPKIIDATEPKKGKKRSQMHPAWLPSEKSVQWVTERWAATHDQIVRQAEQFRDYHLGKGSLMADWEAAWRTWWRNGYHKIPRCPSPSLSTNTSPAELDAAYKRMRAEEGQC